MINESIQSAVVPYRLTENSVEILLITSLKKKKWIIPKGYVEYSLTPFESAKKEAYEEAGITGSNETEQIGEYVVENKFSKKLVLVYLMRVIALNEDYPEKHLRKRKWFSIDEAIQTVDNEAIKKIINELKLKL
jgi:8-oxo-dGTP pyrophosphatase MutT (NUDIX family)